jgi:hypothetical protein
MARKSIKQKVSVGGVSAKASKPTVRRVKMPSVTIKKAPVIPLVTLDGDRMYPDQAKKYWANIKRTAS